MVLLEINRVKLKKVATAARAVIEQVKWDCGYSRLFRCLNLGCGIQGIQELTGVTGHVGKQW